MNLTVRSYTAADEEAMRSIWNAIVEAGDAFPQNEPLDEEGAHAFFAAQTHCGVAEDRDTGSILGLYILHPNNVGRCGHICNASYAVSKDHRHQGVGEALVRDCLIQSRFHQFRILQFNAVVSSNLPARLLYEKLGFIQLGTIPGGFRMKSGEYADICPYYLEL